MFVCETKADRELWRESENVKRQERCKKTGFNKVCERNVKKGTNSCGRMDWSKKPIGPVQHVFLHLYPFNIGALF